MSVLATELVILVIARTAAAAPPLAFQPRSKSGLVLPLALAAAILIFFGRKRVSMPMRAMGIVLALAVLFFALSYWLRPLLAALGHR
jgi:hypothetical protein